MSMSFSNALPLQKGINKTHLISYLSLKKETKIKRNAFAAIYFKLNDLFSLVCSEAILGYA
jgi:hypothetical protein